MNPERELRKRVLSGDLTEQIAEDIAMEWGEKETEIAWDRKVEKEIQKNENTGNNRGRN